MAKAALSVSRYDFTLGTVLHHRHLNWREWIEGAEQRHEQDQHHYELTTIFSLGCTAVQ